MRVFLHTNYQKNNTVLLELIFSLITPAIFFLRLIIIYCTCNSFLAKSLPFSVSTYLNIQIQTSSRYAMESELIKR